MLQQESIIGSWLQLFILAYTVKLLTKGPAHICCGTNVIVLLIIDIQSHLDLTVIYKYVNVVSVTDNKLFQFIDLCESFLLLWGWSFCVRTSGGQVI